MDQIAASLPLRRTASRTESTSGASSESSLFSDELDACALIVTLDEIRCVLECELDALGQQGVSIPDWNVRFPVSPNSGGNLRDELIGQLRRFIASPEYVHLSCDFLESKQKIEAWLCDCCEFAMDAPERIRITTALERFVERYLNHSPDDADFLGALSMTHYDVFQRTCLDWRRIGLIASFVKWGMQGMSDCRAWCREISDHLLSTLMDVSGPGGALTVCEPGMVTAFNTAVSTLVSRVCPPDLENRYQEARIRLFHQVVASVVARNPGEIFNPAGNEVHVVNTWRAFVGGRYGVSEPLRDVLASQSMLGSPQFQQQMITELDFRLNPMRCAHVVMMECQQDIDALLPDASAPVSMERLQEITQQLQPQWGRIPPDALVETDMQSGVMTRQRHPDLLFAHVLDLLLDSESGLGDVDRGELRMHMPQPVVLSWTSHSGQAGSPDAPATSETISSLVCWDGSEHDTMSGPVYVWLQQNLFQRDGTVRIERSLPELSDFPVDYLQRLFERDPSGYAHETRLLESRAVMLSMVSAWLRATPDEIRQFAAQKGLNQIGLDQIDVWPGTFSFEEARLVWALHVSMHPSAGAGINVIETNQPFNEVARIGLLVHALVNDRLELLETLLRRGYIEPNTPLSDLIGHVRFDRLVGQNLQNLLVQRRFLNADFWLKPLAVGVVSPHWDIPDHHRHALVQALIDCGRLNPTLPTPALPRDGLQWTVVSEWLAAGSFVSDEQLIRLTQLPGFDLSYRHGRFGNLLASAVAYDRCELVGHLLALRDEQGKPVFDIDPPCLPTGAEMRGLRPQSPVHTAIQYARPAALRLLLDHGACLRGTLPGGSEPIWRSQLSLLIPLGGILMRERTVALLDLIDNHPVYPPH